MRLLWGEDDAWVSVKRAHVLAERIPGAALRTVPEAGHLLLEDSAA